MHNEKLIGIIVAMKNIHYRDKDLNLLPIFQALMEDRNVSKAAKRLGLTQSAVSHALKRLRADFNDDLLVRGSKGMVATPFAAKVREMVAEASEALAQVYSRSETLDLKRIETKITVATTEYIEVAAYPALLAEIRKLAPGITLSSRPTIGQLPKAELESGQVDLAIAGFFGELPEGFFQKKLFSDGYASCVRKRHPLLGELGEDRKVNADVFARYQHVLISPQGDMVGHVDVQLNRIGLKRRVVAGTSSFLSPAWMVATSDLVVTAPQGLIRAYEKFFPVESFETPLSLSPIHIVQVWHERTHRSPIHKWFRGAIEESMTSTRELRGSAPKSGEVPSR